MSESGLQHNMAAPSQPPQTPPKPPNNTVPTVRVMRLYKPCLHASLSHTDISSQSAVNGGEVDASSGANSCNSYSSDNFFLTPYLLFPDSFGDIYCGEVFSAYISIVNGSAYNNMKLVSMSVRLQGSNNVHDLKDIYSSSCEANTSKSVNDGAAPSETAASSTVLNVLDREEHFDTVVKHRLDELGVQILRVSIQYISGDIDSGNKVETLRKFYRFNVIQPVEMTDYKEISFYNNDTKERITTVQNKATNLTKAHLFVEKNTLSKLSDYNNVEYQLLHISKDFSENHTILGDYSKKLQHFSLTQSCYLEPNESFTYSYINRESSSSTSVSSGDKGKEGSDNLNYSHNITWTTFMGETGNTENSRVAFESRISNDNNIEMKCAKNNIVLSKTFAV